MISASAASPVVSFLLFSLMLQGGSFVGAGVGAVWSLGSSLSKLSRNINEHILDVVTCLCRRLEIDQLFIIDKTLHLFLRDCLIRDVSFVSHEDKHSIGVSVALDLVDPVVFDVHKGVSVVEVEDEEDGM
jgi:hypothetical protein